MGLNPTIPLELPEITAELSLSFQVNSINFHFIVIFALLLFPSFLEGIKNLEKFHI